MKAPSSKKYDDHCWNKYRRRRKEAPLLNVLHIKPTKTCDGYHKCQGESRDLTWDSCKQCALEGMNATTVQN